VLTALRGIRGKLSGTSSLPQAAADAVGRTPSVTVPADRAVRRAKARLVPAAIQDKALLAPGVDPRDPPAFALHWAAMPSEPDR